MSQPLPLESELPSRAPPWFNKAAQHKTKVQGSVANRAVEGVKIENVSFLFWPLSICLGVNFVVNSTPPGHLNALSWADSHGPPGTCPQSMHMHVRMRSLLPAEFLRPFTSVSPLPAGAIM